MKKNNKEKKAGDSLANYSPFTWNVVFRNKWVLPFTFAVIFIFILSLRLLSDPDLGFHLNAGKWIMGHLAFPGKDTFTYTATQNDYIDLHWLFQVIVYFIYKIFSYEGLSIMVACLSMALLYVLLRRNYFLGIPLWLSCALFLSGFMMIEPRIVLRPEMVTYIFITVLLFILDGYYYHKTGHLQIIPVLMLLWCNIHSLFILGIAITCFYFLSIWIKDRKIDRHFFVWMCISFTVCFINPYFIKGFTFPFELFSRFDSNNIYNQHIKEFRSFVHLDNYVARDILFIIFAGITIILTLLTLKKRKIHELLLTGVFLYFALISVRNIPLFVIVAIPVCGISYKEMWDRIREKSFSKKIRWIKTALFYLLLFIPVCLVFRLFTNVYYYSDESYFKTGAGIDLYQQPEKASEFIISHQLKGKMLNSIGFGGWLAWRTNQAVFIDGRLEVMKENLYNEVVESWNDELPKLIGKYNPELIVYNYLKYYRWTGQIAKNPEWRLIYLDGAVAIFSKSKDSTNTPAINISALPEKYSLGREIDGVEITGILNHATPGWFKIWMEGFYKKVDYTNRSLLNIASFCLQVNQYKTAERFFTEALRKTEGRENNIYYALADLYRIRGDGEKAEICYRRILKFDPGNKTIIFALQELKDRQADTNKTAGADNKESEAKSFFNSGNKKYENRDIEGALMDYNKAIALKPDYFKAYNNRGILKAAELKKDSEALKDFDKAIEINPDYADAYLGRGTSKYNLKDNEGSCNDWRKALALGNMQALKQIERYCK